jgi:hypothetical protein
MCKIILHQITASWNVLISVVVVVSYNDFSERPATSVYKAKNRMRGKLCYT